MAPSQSLAKCHPLATLMVMHPDFYASGMETLLRMAYGLFGGVGDSESGNPFP
ncbi:hypothetical protein PAXRUDRAFT_21676 [Paxillus rubicundulus Ve08.2h10]|uniref:Uncharacterized protein n=1 Tax=Paxillus rubicundulus Ve08.2h10 TaxID=930991 RepID=A0A0D0CYY9_9AGAM|nr:hypothetical protein PAXRUDRAFT_21676 [Paxillus rubicundulus Ve08.2h10]